MAGEPGRCTGEVAPGGLCPERERFPLFIKHKSRSQSAEAPRLRRVTVKKWEMKPASKDLGLSSCPTERVKELTCSLL